MTRQLAIQVLLAAYYRALPKHNNWSKTGGVCFALSIDNLKDLCEFWEEENITNDAFKENTTITPHNCILCGEYPGFKECSHNKIRCVDCQFIEKYDRIQSIVENSDLYQFVVILYEFIKRLYFSKTSVFASNIDVSDFIEMLVLTWHLNKTKESKDDAKNNNNDDEKIDAEKIYNDKMISIILNKPNVKKLFINPTNIEFLLNSLIEILNKYQNKNPNSIGHTPHDCCKGIFVRFYNYFYYEEHKKLLMI